MLTPARCIVQNFIQFYGYFEFSWGETSRERVPRGGTEVYPYVKAGKLRTEDKVEKNAKLITENGVPFYGVVGFSP